jgi:predicted nuclease of restriction endonuclease-like RecB superfamily
VIQVWLDPLDFPYPLLPFAMLPTDLLIHRPTGESVTPKRLPLNDTYRAIAAELIDLFTDSVGATQGELNRQLQDLEGEDTDYRIKRGLAHILRNSLSTFEIVSPLDPQDLRQRVFAAAAPHPPVPHQADLTLQQLAQVLSQELDREVMPAHIRAGLYADLEENRILTHFEAITPDQLLHRYNLAQVQGIFYKASQVVIHAHRNDPGEYKLLFRYLKLFQLMAYIEGDADQGFTIAIDGPTSLFKPSTRYGLDIAKLLPALLHVTKWSLQATLMWRDSYTKQQTLRQFTLVSDCGLQTHYPPGKPYDSMLEASFAERWAELKTDWVLEREVDLIPIPGSVMIPDFRLVHPDGRTYLLEIVGYWRPEYLRKKFSQVRQSECPTLILAVSERLNLEKAGVKLSDLPVKVVWFKTKLSPKAVLEVLD